MRLVDLHCDWLRQYATETTLYEADLYPEIPGRVGRLDGYLLGTSLAVLTCSRKAEDWSRRPDPWQSLGLLIARHEAEFAGRLLRDAGDAPRWRSSPADGMCWGVIGVAGFDSLVREAVDLDRLPALFHRGVRVFQPIAAGGGVLGGSMAPGDGRGLTGLGLAFLDRVAEIARRFDGSPRAILDLAGMNAAAIADALGWLDGQPTTSGRPLIVVSHGTGPQECPLDDSSPEGRNLREIRSRGGLIGLMPGRPGCETTEDLERRIEAIAAMPFEGRPGYQGIAIGTDLLELDQVPSSLGSAREILRWLRHAFDREVAEAIAVGNARRLLLRSVGDDPQSEPRGVADAPRS
jgi:membrane dipeptidase